MTSYTKIKTKTLGELLLVANDTKLTGIYYADCEHAPKPKADWKLDPKHPILKQAGEELRAEMAEQARREGRAF